MHEWVNIFCKILEEKDGGLRFVDSQVRKSGPGAPSFSSFHQWGYGPPARLVVSLNKSRLSAAEPVAILSMRILPWNPFKDDLLDRAVDSTRRRFGVCQDLGEKIDSEKLASVSVSFPKSIVQRLGHLLDQLGHAGATQPMLRELLREQLPPWVELDPEEVAEPQLAPKCIERDKRWNIVVRRKPEVDE